MTAPFIVMCAPNGARKTRKDHPAIPLTAAELADTAAAIADAGAALIHVHVRDDDGRHSLDAARYRSAMQSIRAAVGDRLVVQVTTEACGVYDREAQMAVVRELRPEAVSLGLREIAGDEDACESAAGFYDWLHREGIMAQHILYSVGEVERFERLRARGVIPGDRPFVLFVLGRYSEDLTGDVGELAAFAGRAAPDTHWAVCCFGATEAAAADCAAGTGGHARVGFENNLLLAGGALAPDNAALVRAAVASGHRHGRSPATADDVRSLFGS